MISKVLIFIQSITMENKLKISLLHPSRGRAEKAHATFMHWLLYSSLKYEIEHILSLDSDDKQISKYRFLFTNSIILENNNSSLVEATNRAAAIATGDILIYLSDDFVCPNDWDEKIVQMFKAHGLENPMILKTDDGLQKFEVDIVTIPIMNRALYLKLGYLWHPAYKSMFVDQDLYWTCRNNNWMHEVPHLKFPHHHYCNGLAEKDDTYMRNNAHWNSGKETYYQRKAANFPL